MEESYKRPGTAPDQVIIHKSTIEKSIQHLQEYGKKDLEGCLFFYGFFFKPGYVSSIEGKNKETVALVQGAYLAHGKAASGGIHIDSKAYGEFCREISNYNEKGIRFFEISIVHSHPDRAFHSSIDNDAIVLHPFGTLSIVIPHFAREISVKNFLRNSEVFELVKMGADQNQNHDDIKAIAQNAWLKHWSPEEKQRRIKIISSNEEFLASVPISDKFKEKIAILQKEIGVKDAKLNENAGLINQLNNEISEIQDQLKSTKSQLEQKIQSKTLFQDLGSYLDSFFDSYLNHAESMNKSLEHLLKQANDRDASTGDLITTLKESISTVEKEMDRYKNIEESFYEREEVSKNEFLERENQLQDRWDSIKSLTSQLVDQKLESISDTLNRVNDVYTDLEAHVKNSEKDIEGISDFIQNYENKLTNVVKEHLHGTGVKILTKNIFVKTLFYQVDGNLNITTDMVTISYKNKRDKRYIYNMPWDSIDQIKLSITKDGMLRTMIDVKGKDIKHEYYMKDITPEIINEYQTLLKEYTRNLVICPRVFQYLKDTENKPVYDDVSQ